MANAYSVLTVENKKEIAKKISVLNKIQMALTTNPSLTLDQMLLNTQITPEARAAYEKLIAQARCLIAGTMQQSVADKNVLYQTLAQNECFNQSEADLLLLSYALELRLNGFKPITAAVQKEAENRFVAHFEAPSIFAETDVNDVFAATPEENTPVQEEPEPTSEEEEDFDETSSVSESLSNSRERDVLKRELLTRTRALIKLNETNRVVEMNGHKVPYPILNPYFDIEGHLNIGFTDLTNNAYLLGDLQIQKDKVELSSDDKDAFVSDLEEKYDDMGRPEMKPEEFAEMDGFKEFSVSPDNASQVADLQIRDDLDDLINDLENADLSLIPFQLLQVALDIVYETGYSLQETNPALFEALLNGNFDSLTDEDYIPQIDDIVWNDPRRTKRRRALVQQGLMELQRNNVRPMGGAGKVAETPDASRPVANREKQNS